MYFRHDDDQVERDQEQPEQIDPFEAFGDLDEPANDSFDDAQDIEDIGGVQNPVAPLRPEAPQGAVTAGSSLVGFIGAGVALIWLGGVGGGALAYFGADALAAMQPQLQAGLVALIGAPALLFWLTATAAGESVKARRLALELARMAKASRAPFELREGEAHRLSHVVKDEIGSLNEAVDGALARLSQLETATHRNAAMFGEAVDSSRENIQAMSAALAHERSALNELNGDLKTQTETVATSIGRQVRLLREASKLVKGEIVEAEDALEAHLAGFAAAASAMNDNTLAFKHAADHASTATTSLNGSMTRMLDSLVEATRLSESARKSSEQAVQAASETAGALRDTTREAVLEAQRAAELVRSETQSLQAAANDTLSTLQEAANAARVASDESQAAAQRHAHAIEKRLAALASVSGKPAARPVVQRTENATPRAPANTNREAPKDIYAAASFAMARAKPAKDAKPAAKARMQSKWSLAWTDKLPRAANAERPAPAMPTTNAEAPDESLRARAIDLVLDCGVDLDRALQASDLSRIAQSSRDGAAARRRAVLAAAPGAVGRITRHIKRSDAAQEIATQFRARPDLAKSSKKQEASELVRAYLLIDAALAS